MKFRDRAMVNRSTIDLVGSFSWLWLAIPGVKGSSRINRLSRFPFRVPSLDCSNSLTFTRETKASLLASRSSATVEKADASLSLDSVLLQ